MNLKIILVTFISLVLFNSKIYSQNNHVAEINDNGFAVNYIPPSPKYHDIKKGKFVIRDYYQYTDVSKAGTYKLPSENIILALPPNSKPSFKLLNKSERKISSVMPALNPKIESKNDSSFITEQVPYKNARQISNSKPIIEVKGYFWFRNFYCVQLKINSFSYNYQSNQITAVQKLKIGINFSQTRSIEKDSPIQIKSKFDEDLSKIIYNSGIAEQFRANPQIVSSDSTTNWINFNATYIKLAVGNDGLYRISKNYLEQHGISTSQIDPTTFQLFNYGKEIPLFVFGESDNSFDSGDYIEFWGHRNYPSISYRVINNQNEPYNEYLNRYTDTSYYFLTWGNTAGKRVAVENGNLSLPNDTVSYYTEVDHYEENTMYQNNSNDEIANQTSNWNGNKAWYWQWLYAQTKKYNFTIKDIYPNKTAKFFIKYVSAGSNVALNAHNLILDYNGTELDSQSVNRFAQVILKGNINSNSLSDGTHQIEVKNYDNGTVPNYLGMDWYDVEYPKMLLLNNDFLIFDYRDASANGYKSIKVSNVTSSNYSLYEISPSLKKIDNYKIVNNNLYFADTISNNGKFCLESSSKINSPEFVYKKNFVNLASYSNQADYIAITNPKFLSVSSNYVSEISKYYNVSTKLENVFDIYDQYGFGYPTPESIKLFLMNAMQSWQNPKPSYLALIGDADYDYKGYLLKSVGVRLGENYVPSFGDPVGDDWYAIWGNSPKIPQLKVGRIPINKASELTYYLNKVTKNDQQAFGEWNKRYMFFSGGSKADEYALFNSVNERVISSVIKPRPVAGFYTHFYKTQTPQTDFGPYTNEQVQNSIDSGGVFISYLGHSGTATWDNSISNVTQLQNKVDRYPLITDFGCSTNKFAEPDIISFGENFLLNSNGQAIGYVGNSSLGFTSTATNVPMLFYESLFSDSLHEVGNAHLMAKTKLFTIYGSSGVNEIFSYSNILLGDPTVRLRIPEKPNLLLNSNSLILPSGIITETSDSVKVGIILENDGKAPADSFYVRIKHSLSSGNLIQNKIIHTVIPGYKDTLFVWLKTKNLSGQHDLSVQLDSLNNIDEIYKNDDNFTFTFNVTSTTLKDLAPYMYENSELQKIKILSPSEYYRKNFNIKLQLAQSEDFSTPNNITQPADSFYTFFSLPKLISGQRYWYRYNIDTVGSSFSQPKSFLNEADGKYLISDSVAFSHQNLVNLSYSKANGVRLKKDTANISVLSAGWYAGATCVISKNGTNLLSNSFFPGMAIVVFDSATMKVDTSAWFALFNNKPNVQALTNLINSIPTGKIVAMGVSDDAENNITAGLKNAIKTLGSTKIDQLQFRGSWAIIGRKGAAPGDVLEEIKDPHAGSITIDSTFNYTHQNGQILVNDVGPASSWKSISYTGTTPSDSKINFYLFGIKQDGEVDSLGIYNSSNSNISLSSINAKVYPNLKLSIDLEASSDGQFPSLSKYFVDYENSAELGLNYQTVSISRDSVYQGKSLEYDYTLFNAGDSPADSFNVQIVLTKPDHTTKSLLDTLITELSAGNKLSLYYDYNSNLNDGYGNFSISANIDPNNSVGELYKDNNYFSKSFYVIKDTLTLISDANISMLFNDKNIFNGDYVSPDPSIKFVLNYGINYPFRDTSKLNFKLDGKSIYYSGMDSITYDTINRKVDFMFHPHLKNGEHSINIQGDGLSNQAGDLQRTFYVANELKIMNLYNYPNPFKSYTYFTFNLTRIPEQLKINLYTIAGRLIKVITIPKSKLNNNFNKIYWDGRDENGDLVANGVYLYKIIAKLSNKTYTDIQKLAVIR